MVAPFCGRITVLLELAARKLSIAVRSWLFQFCSDDCSELQFPPVAAIKPVPLLLAMSISRAVDTAGIFCIWVTAVDSSMLSKIARA